MVGHLRALLRPRQAPRLRFPNWRKTEAGQSLVEFAMVLPIFLLLLFALVDFGRGFYTWMIITNAAREGARAGAVQMDAAGIDTKIRDSYCNSYPSDCSLDPARMFVLTDGVQDDRGKEVKVTISYDFEFVTPIGGILRIVSGGSLDAPTITASSSMRLE